jgi:hypothetical protein
MTAALKLVSTNDLDVAVNTEAAQTALADKLDSLSVVTAYAHAISNTVINPVSTPAESWYAPLNENLNGAKAHALIWIRDIAPKVGSEIPQTIINYNNTFNAAAEELLSIIGTKTSLSLAEKNQVIELIEFTLSSLSDQKSKVDGIQSKIITLSNDFAADHDKLVSGKDSAAKAVQLADEERLRIEHKIAELQTDLADARQKVTASGIGLGLGIFLAVAAFALAVATAGAATALIVAGAVGVVGVGVAATFTGIFTAKIGRLIEEIAGQQAALKDKQKQVVALKGLVDTMDKLKGHNEAAKMALTNISTMWGTLNGKLEAVLKDLKGATGDASTTIQRMNIKAARKSWTDTAAYAQQVQDLASGTKVQPILQHAALVHAF